MVSVCTVPARGGRSCEHFGGYKTINRIPLPLYAGILFTLYHQKTKNCIDDIALTNIFFAKNIHQLFSKASSIHCSLTH